MNFEKNGKNDFATTKADKLGTIIFLKSSYSYSQTYQVSEKYDLN